jgi:anti-sigma B factor antagonist
MTLQTRVKTQNTTTLVTLTGRLDTNTAPELDQQLNDILQTPPAMLVFNMAQLEYISSAGLRVIFKAVKAVKSTGGQCGVLKMPPAIKKVFDIVKALPDVPIFKDDQEMDAYLSAMQQQAQ